MINSCVIMGRLTYEPELKTTANGLSVIQFQVAVDRKNTKDKAADFIDVVAWRKTADFISKYFHKGSMIAVEGHIQVDAYTDKDGNKRKAVRIVADSVSFCGSKADDEVEREEFVTTKKTAADYDRPQSTYDDFEEITDEDDDLPF